MRGTCVLLVVALLFSVSLVAQEEQFLLANNAYNDSDHKRSIELYNEILTNGDESSDLYLNLGNAYFKNGELGKAILSYERGLKIDDDHEFLSQNLKYAQKQIKAPITTIPDFFLSRYWNAIVTSLGSTGWAVVNVVILILIALAVGSWLLSTQFRAKKMAFYSLLILIPVLLLSMLAGNQKYNSEVNASHAVIISDESQLLTGASSKSETIQDLSEGIKVKLIDRIDDYYKIQLMDKEIGWISIKDIEAI